MFVACGGHNIPMIRLLFFALLLFSVTVRAQISGNDPLQLRVKLHALNFASLVRPTLQGSIELVANNKYGIELAYGIRINGNKGRNLVAEFRYYTPFGEPASSKSADKVQLRDFALISYRNVFDRRYYPVTYKDPVNDAFLKDTTLIQTRISAIAIGYGIIMYYKRFSVEFSGEMGYMHKEKVWYDNKLSGQGYKTKMHWEESALHGVFPRDSHTLSLNIAIKLGYRIF